MIPSLQVPTRSRNHFVEISPLDDSVEMTVSSRILNNTPISRAGLQRKSCANSYWGRLQRKTRCRFRAAHAQSNALIYMYLRLCTKSQQKKVNNGAILYKVLFFITLSASLLLKTCGQPFVRVRPFQCLRAFLTSSPREESY